MLVELKGKYYDCILGVDVECRVYQHGHWNGKQHVEKFLGVETVRVSKSFMCPGFGSTVCVRRDTGRSYILSKDDDGSFCIVI